MLKNFVLETATNPGQAVAVTLAGPPSGRIGFVAAFGSGAVCFYVLDDGLQQEWGIGTVLAGTPNVLQRTTVLGNSAGTTERLNYTSAINVYCDVPAERLPWFDAANTLALGNRRITGLADATSPSDAAALQQLGSRHLASAVVSGLAASVVFSLPASCTRWRLEWQGMVPQAAGSQLFARFSFDGGATYAQGATDYNICYESVFGGVLTTGNQAGAFLPLSPLLPTNGNGAFGEMEFETVGKIFKSDGHAVNQTPAHNRYRVGGRCDNAGATFTHVMLSFTAPATGITAGRARLVGRV